MIEERRLVITVDGAGGTGKGTVSQLLANHLGWRFLDSGALYRALALAVQKRGIALNDAQSVEVLAKHLDVQFITQVGASPKIIFEGEDVTHTIRTETIGNTASIIAVIPAVRSALLSRQRDFREPLPSGLVADGRDMGTVVFPDADLKIFLIASPEERAVRRYKQLKAQGINVTLALVLEELQERDRRDQGRAVAPLKPAKDAVIINTDGIKAEQVVEKIIIEIERKKAFPAISFQKNNFFKLTMAEEVAE